ncbi:MAG: Chromate resistance protein ChrB, partial [Sulfuricella sp.]
MRAFGTDKWLVIVLSLPTSNATVRTRVWRALKGLGCAVLRDGVYLLPAGRGLRQALRMYVEEVRQGGGSAFLLNVSSAAGEERAEFQGLFDRRAEYREVAENIDVFKAGFAALDTVAGRRQLKALRRDL